MKKQKGFATLLVSAVLIFLVTLNVFIGAKGSVLEQKSANNLYRSEIAFENAEEGVRATIAALIANPALAVADYTPAKGTTATGTYTVKYFYNGGVNSYIASTGTDTSNATRTVTQRITYTPGKLGYITSPITGALTTLGNVSLGGSASASSVNAGGTNNNKAGSVSGTTTSNSSEFKVALLDSNGNILLDSNGQPVYRAMTSDEYFMHYFGGLCPSAVNANNASACQAEAQTTVQNSAKGYYCTTNCDAKSGATSLTAQYSLGKRIFWITQDSPSFNANGTLGSETDPVIVIFINNGTVSFSGNYYVYGVVYVGVPDQLQTLMCSCHNVATATASNPVIKGYDTTGSTWTSTALTLNAGNSSMCTVNACTNAATTCTPATTTSPTQGATVTASCDYAAAGVSGTNNTPVQINQTLGTWNEQGSGNSTIKGAALTSGNFTANGNITITRDAGIIQTFTGNAAGVAPTAFGWSDLN